MRPPTVLAMLRAALADLERAHAQQVTLIAAYRLVIADLEQRRPTV